jgi:hypothetical protein
MVHTDIPEAPWYVVESDQKKVARLNMIAHLLSTIPYYAVDKPELTLPSRPPSSGYQRPPKDTQTYVPDHAPCSIATDAATPAHESRWAVQANSFSTGHVVTTCSLLAPHSLARATP